ncbi:MAG TPA: aldehyde dehydrogenase family protein [Ignavibacteria bacterium]
MLIKQKFIIDFNPRSGKVIEKIKCSSSGEVASAVKLAKKAHKTWKELALKNRISKFHKILKDFKKEKKEIANLISVETGKTNYFALKEVEDSINLLEKFLILSVKTLTNQKRILNNKVIEVNAEPIGVCALITGWKNPVKIPLFFLLPNILSGNTVIFKPSEFTPICGKRIYEILNRHLPKGVITILQGVEEVSDSLLDSDIDFIAFSGRVETGKKIQSFAIKKLLPVVSKLYKKDMLLILKDADLLRATQSILENCFLYSVNHFFEFNRIFVQEKISTKIENMIRKEYEKLEFDDVPFISDDKRNYVLNQISEVNKKGVKILLGGNKINSEGYFIKPTILSEVLNKHQINSEGCSGPVVCLQKITKSEDLIHKLNSHNLLESVTIWTENLNNGLKISKKFRTCKIYINKRSKFQNKSNNLILYSNIMNDEEFVKWNKKFTKEKVIIYNNK